MDNKQKLSAYYFFNKLFQAIFGCMLMMQFIFNPIVNKKADRHRNSTVNELRIFPEPNFTWFILEHFAPNILQNSTNFLRS